MSSIEKPVLEPATSTAYAAISGTSQRNDSPAVRRVCRIDAAGFELGAELSDPVALGEDCRTPDHSHTFACRRYAMYQTGRFNEGAPGRQFLGFALVRTNEVLLGESAARENNVAHSLVVVPRYRVAVLHDKSLDLNRAGHLISGTEHANIIAGTSYQSEGDVRQGECRAGQDSHKTDRKAH